MRPNETRNTSGQTPAATIIAFRQRYGLTLGRLATLLELDLETLCRYEEVGGAPPWFAYALLGVEYQEFGVVTGLENDAQAESARGGANEERSAAWSQDVSSGCEPSPPRGEVSLARDAGSSPADARSAAA